MPVAVFDSGIQSTSTEVGARHLIPGIEPGGSRAGQPFKPALLIKDVVVEFANAARDSTADLDILVVLLKLSQESDLTPGLILPLAQMISGGPASAEHSALVLNTDPGRLLRGSVWAPMYVGLRVEETTGQFNAFQWLVTLSYETILVPWEEWFIMWDFLDNVVDNTREY